MTGRRVNRVNGVNDFPGLSGSEFFSRRTTRNSVHSVHFIHSETGKKVIPVLKGDATQLADFRLPCRDCEAAFVEMGKLLRHREREHEPKREKRPARKVGRLHKLEVRKP